VSGFTTYGPLAVPPWAFAGPLTVDGGSWLAEPHTPSLPAGQLRIIAANVKDLGDTLASAAELPSLTLATSLPPVLTGTASNLDVARSLLAICAVLLFLLAAAALLAVARLLAGQREGESAMLTARGATRWQLVRLSARRCRCACCAPWQARWPASAWPGCWPGTTRPASAGRRSRWPPWSPWARW
jgi:hypothetical protein